jgi:hypothetical protein
MAFVLLLFFETVEQMLCMTNLKLGQKCGCFDWKRPEFDRVLEQLHADTAFEGGVCGRTNEVPRDCGVRDCARCGGGYVLRRRGLESILSSHLEQVAVAPIGCRMGHNTSAHLGSRVRPFAAGEPGTSGGGVDPGKQSFG